jgi:hypothetical protein
MTKKTARTDFTKTNGRPTHALVVEHASFPKDMAPIGTLAELHKVYDRLLSEQLDGLSLAAQKTAIRGFDQTVRLYELNQQPDFNAPRGGLLGSGLELPNIDKNKIVDKIDAFDTKKAVRKATDFGLELGEAWFNKGNPITWIKWGNRANEIRKTAQDIANAATEAGKGAISQVTGATRGDGAVRDGQFYVKLGWLAKPGNATLLPNLDLLGSVEPAQPRKPRRSTGRKPKP